MYTNLPQFIDPVAISVGGFALRWYGLMWLAAFGTVWALLRLRVRRGEARALHDFTRDTVGDMIVLALVGAMVGGRLGYAIFYDWAFFAAHPLALVWPFAEGQFVGISGMSFHGGVLGVAGALWIFAQRQGWSLRAVFDFVVPAVPLGYMFGRIGNFLNHELWGRVTESPIGMYFMGAPDGGTLLRHPSQLYEAFFEGAVLFALLWCVRNRLAPRPGVLTGIFLVGYSLARFVVEFFRAPDAHLGFVIGTLSMGQILSVFTLGIGLMIVVKSVRDARKKVKWLHCAWFF